MKKIYWSVGVMLAICVISCGNDNQVKLAARRASAMLQFEIPTLKVTFSTPLPEEIKNELVLKDIEKLLDEKLKEAIKKEREFQQADKYSRYLVSVEATITPKSKTEIPIGSLPNVPKWAKFPERVLVVFKTEKKELKPWDKDSEKDVYAISVTTGVSIPKAKEMLSKIQAEGYAVSKESVKPDAEVKLLWFDDGWDDNYPVELQWEVCVYGENNNRIKGYNSLGVLTVQTVPDDPDAYGKPKKVFVKAGYLDLKDEFKPIPDDIKKLRDEIEGLKEQLERERDKYKEEIKKEKRDISKATWLDVRMGNVKIDVFYIHTAASGVFIGNAKLDNELYGYKWGSHYYSGRETKGIILTNAHVAEIAEMFEIYVSKDKEKMWILYPGWPSVRYTQDSDKWGSPAPVLCIDGESVLSWDYDCGIMVTSAVPQYEQHKAFLGNSDAVENGDKIVTVGNPHLMQKFLTEGSVSNKNYSAMKSRLSDFWIKHLNRKWFNWLANSNFWYDASIGVGGTSGSGVWALTGSEKGKVVALHNMGMNTSSNNKVLASVGVPVEPANFEHIDDNESFLLVSKFAEKHQKEFFTDNGYKTVDFSEAIFENPSEEYPQDMQLHCGYSRMSGMNGAVPINPIKRYLQERGLDPDNFKFDGADKEYWTR